MKLRVWLDTAFLKYPWYRKWQAKRSRKRLAKKNRLEDDLVESYTPAAVIEEQDKRYRAVLAERARREAEHEQ